MGKLAKLIEKFLRDPPELNYDDVYYLLTHLGFQLTFHGIFGEERG